MATIRRLPITLLEMLIVIAIIALASGVVAISVNKAIVNQRFQTEVGLIVDELRLAQDLMLILGTDVHLHFTTNKSGTGIVYKLILETNLPQNIQREISRKRPVLHTIKGVFFEDKLPGEVKENQIDMKFLSYGAVMSEGILRLASSDDEKVPAGTLESFICLAGYPKPILSSDTKEEAEKHCLKFEEGLDERLTQDTLLKLPEKLKQPNPKESEEKLNEEDDKKKEEEKKTPKKEAAEAK